MKKIQSEQPLTNFFYFFFFSQLQLKLSKAPGGTATLGFAISHSQSIDF